MPVRLTPSSGEQQPEARIEIIPLIDIMFFLLAAFMLVSLSMVESRGVPVNLPTASSENLAPDKKGIRLTVDKAGLVYLDQRPIGDHELIAAIESRRQAAPELPVTIRGDRQARHGDILRVLDRVRSAGVEKVAFEADASGEPPNTRNGLNP